MQKMALTQRGRVFPVFIRWVGWYEDMTALCPDCNEYVMESEWEEVESEPVTEE